MGVITLEPTDQLRLEETAESGSYRLEDQDGHQGPDTSCQHLEAQFRCRLGYLALVSEDWPIEEHLDILLVDPNLAVLDRVNIGTWYAADHLTNLRNAEGELDFDMFGYHWHLRVHATPGWFLRFACPVGARRPLARSFAPRYLELARKQLTVP